VTSNVAQPGIDTKRGWLGALENAASQMGRLEISLLLTLLLLVFYPPRYVYISLPLSVIAIAAIVLPTLRHNRYVWLFAAFLVGAVSLSNWHSTDNHKYLLCYWCLAIFCSFSTKDPEQSLAQIARWLIAAVFSIAVLQKFLSSDYLNSDFFYFELLFDKRFSGLAQYVGGIQEFINDLNTSARHALVNYDSALIAVKLSSNSSLLYLAKFITWWNFLIQVMIAVSFLAPTQTWLAKWRHPMLLVFLFCTYLFAPVIGFGWVLIILGIAQLDPAATRTRLLYLLAFILLQIYKYPWSSLMPS